MNRIHTMAGTALAVAALALTLAQSAWSAVSRDEAAQLRTSLTPMGAERAGNKEGSIPPWTGTTTPGAGIGAEGRRSDPFASEKPLFSVNAKNMGQYGDKLSEGTKALLRKYADTFRLDVYTTHRTAVAPQWIYDNTLRNATTATLIEGEAGPRPQGAYGGVPFPIPKNANEVLWNHKLTWRGTSWYWEFFGYQLSTDGRWVLSGDTANDHQMPYYVQDGRDKFADEYWLARSLTKGPAIRAGDAITGRANLDEGKVAAWVYLTGQRRVRKLPNSCCDTPTPFSAGLTTFDETEVLQGRVDRFEWKLLGKREIFIPYNSNRLMVPTKAADVLGPRHLNPDFVRWELHRVWVVEGVLKPGQRHTAHKSRYYLDEDTWQAVLAERYDGNGELARVPFGIPMVMSDLPATAMVTWGVYDLTSGTSYINGLVNERRAAYKPMPLYRDVIFTPDAMAGDGVR